MQRRNVVVRTLDYLNDERRNVAINRIWKTSSTQRIRLSLLDEIRAWYDAELTKIDTVLKQVNEPSARSEKSTQ
jgi:hypothetical protein